MSKLKKVAKQLSGMGRYGDTELVHLNKEEQELIEKYRGAKLNINPKTGLKEGFGILPMAKQYFKWQAGKKQREGEKEISLAELGAKEKAIAAAKQIQPGEAQAMAQMRKAAAEGTMDVAALNQQMAQPLYQQGQAQQAQALGQITRQGLEGSVIAQEASRKIGSDVRASIAEQARQIAFNNEQTKAGAQQRHQAALMKRGSLLRDLAAKKAGLSSERDIIDLKQKYGDKVAAWQQGEEFTQEIEDNAKELLGMMSGGGGGGGAGGAGGGPY